MTHEMKKKKLFQLFCCKLTGYEVCYIKVIMERKLEMQCWLNIAAMIDVNAFRVNI